MSISYENQRVVFDRIVRQYNEYLALYKELTGGAEGITPFADFYWRMTYLSQYQDPTTVNHQRY